MNAVKADPIWAASDASDGSWYGRRDCPAVGTVIDKRYELLRDLGRGAAGIVFEAQHCFTARRVALKMISPDVPISMIGEMKARLIREARALSAVRHPGVVDILDGGIAEGGMPYIVMEMLEGRSLEGLLTARGRLSLEDTLAVTLQLCDALGAAHRANVVHRDLKPGNVFIVRDPYGYERLKLVDFGIAQLRQTRDAKLTGVGAVLGTPEYMSPEQLLAYDDIDHRADVYALGVTMFECLAGRVPYIGNYQQVLVQAASGHPIPELAALVPEAGDELGAISLHALAKKRDDRFATTNDLARAIQNAFPGVARKTRLLGPPPLPAHAVSPTTSRKAPEPAESMVQRRRVARTPYATPVHVDCGAAALDGRSEDISEGGMLVICRGSCTPGARVKIRFAVPIDGRVVELPADVRWVRAARPDDPDGARAIGLEFVAPPPAVSGAIGRFVELMGVAAPPVI